MAAYSTARGYHDLRHLAEVLQRITELGAGDHREVVLAAWFHDAVYDTAAGAGGSVPDTNEERSARLAEQELAGEDIDVVEVARLVRLTAEHRPGPGDTAGELLCDADLAILASATPRYQEYVADVRAEYAAYDDRDFASGRIAVLEDLLGKPQLFHTVYARKHWESPARENMAAELQRLREVLR